MSSNESDRADRRFRGRATDAALQADREGRRRLVDAADEAPPSSHGEKSRNLPGVREDERL